MKQRFVHSMSPVVYDKISTLWHIDGESEELLAPIAAKVVVGMFCMEYLSHIHSLLKQRNKIRKRISALDLSDEKFAASIRTKVSRDRKVTELFKRTARTLKRFIDSVDIKTLDDLTRIAHTGDYLLSSLQDMKDSGHAEYDLWMGSIPYYYEKDLRHLNAMKVNIGSIMAETGETGGQKAPFWSEQFPAELFHLEKIHSAHRVDLNAYLPHDAMSEGYFPCAQPRGKEGGTAYSKARS